MRILLVDDHRSARLVLRTLLESVDGAHVCEADSEASALVAIERDAPDLVLLDIRLSDNPIDRGGLSLLRRLRGSGNAVAVIVITSVTEIAEVREAMRAGAQDYVFKDELSEELLLPLVEAVRERLSLRRDVLRLMQRFDRSWGLAAIVGSSLAMEHTRKLIERLADSASSVLIRGPTGAGKELVARALHQCGVRRQEPFVAVNCSALPSQLVESLLFGHERGAFTGAQRRAKGHFEAAGRGTVLLDEIAEMPPDLQAKLLRVLEDRRFRPLGSDEELPLNARVLAATHADLEARIADGRFREDLFFRLNVVTIDIPPLSERPEDIPELVLALSSDLAPHLRFTEDAMNWFRQRAWSGNVRELRNAVERVALLAEVETLDAAMLELLVPLRKPASTRNIEVLARDVLALPTTSGSKLHAIERAVLTHALAMVGGNKSAAARLIGCDRKALDRRLERLRAKDDS